MTTLKYDRVLVKINTTLNGIRTMKSSRQVMNNMVNFNPNRGTLVSTDHTVAVWLLGKSVIVE